MQRLLVVMVSLSRAEAKKCDQVGAGTMFVVRLPVALACSC